MLEKQAKMAEKTCPRATIINLLHFDKTVKSGQAAQPVTAGFENIQSPSVLFLSLQNMRLSSAL